MNLQEKINYSINLLKKAETLALNMHEDGFHLAFSGGKDSVVLYQLAQMSGVKFKAYMNVTTIDPPELLKFIRGNYPDVKFNLPEINFYQLIKKKMMLPLRQARYCCSYLKEQSGGGTCTLVGVRSAESARRSKRNEAEIAGHKYSNTLDQFTIDLEQKHVCIKGKDKVIISPIFNWTDRDIWKFIKENNIPYCKLYNEGYSRIGCIFCPMASKKSKFYDRLRYPKIEKAIKKSIQYLIDKNNYMNKFGATADEIFDWWVSNESTKKYFGMLRNQLKIEFEQ
jgi:phosphoadenosine phosphosulfate reductase